MDILVEKKFYELILNNEDTYIICGDKGFVDYLVEQKIVKEYKLLSDCQDECLKYFVGMLNFFNK